MPTTLSSLRLYSTITSLSWLSTLLCHTRILPSWRLVLLADALISILPTMSLKTRLTSSTHGSGLIRSALRMPVLLQFLVAVSTRVLQASSLHMLLSTTSTRFSISTLLTATLATTTRLSPLTSTQRSTYARLHRRVYIGKTASGLKPLRSKYTSL